MWWKFWTWFRPDSAHEGGSRSRNVRPAVRASVDSSAQSESEDILSSISNLIDTHQHHERTDRPATRTYDAIQLSDAKATISKESSGLETWANDEPVEAKGVESPASISDVSTAENKPEETPNQLGETARPGHLDLGTNRRPEQSDRPANSMKTLTAENGEWPGFDTPAEGFGDFDDDDDESDGTSPYQTIVPRDH